MQPDHLALFTWQPASKVLLFPLRCRVGKVRQTATKLLAKHGEDADLYWKQVTAANRKHLERLGLPEAEIWAELHAFFDAVQAEMVRRSYSGRTEGGVA